MINKNLGKSLKQLQVRFSADYDEEVIEQLYDFGKTADKQRYLELEERLKEIVSTDNLDDDEKAIFIDRLSDENNVNQQTIELISEMQIVALFKSAEIAIKNMMKYSGLFTENDLKKAYQFKTLTKTINAKLALDLNTLAGYSAFDELRLINNGIKHSGLVSEDLAKYPNWKKGAKINEFHLHYKRLKQGVRAFVFDFRDKVLAKI